MEISCGTKLHPCIGKIFLPKSFGEKILYPPKLKGESVPTKEGSPCTHVRGL